MCGNNWLHYGLDVMFVCNSNSRHSQSTLSFVCLRLNHISESSSIKYTGSMYSTYAFLWRWLWEYGYLILLLSSSNRKYESLSIVCGYFTVWDVYFCVLNIIIIIIIIIKFTNIAIVITSFKGFTAKGFKQTLVYSSILLTNHRPNCCSCFAHKELIDIY